MRRSTVLFAFFLLLALPGAAATQGDRETLAGVTGFQVAVERLPERLLNVGFTEGMIRAAIEERLRSAGLPVDHEASPYLYVVINATDEGRIASVATTVEFRQVVLLVRDRSKSAVAGTWSSSAVSSFGARALVAGIRTVVSALADEFARDFLAVNP